MDLEISQPNDVLEDLTAVNNENDMPLDDAKTLSAKDDSKTITTDDNIKEDNVQAEQDALLLREQFRWLAKTIQNLKKKKDAQLFLLPVDPVALGIPTYFDVVKNPMDISTIERKLSFKEYSSVQEVKQDFDLMFNNCYLFNGPDSAVSVIGKSLQTSFDREMLKLPKTVKQQEKKKRSLVFSEIILGHSFNR